MGGAHCGVEVPNGNRVPGGKTNTMRASLNSHVRASFPLVV